MKYALTTLMLGIALICGCATTSEDAPVAMETTAEDLEGTWVSFERGGTESEGLPAGEQCVPAGSADGSSNVEISEFRTRSRQAVDPGRLVVFAPEARQVGVAEVIDEDQQNAGAFAAGVTPDIIRLCIGVDHIDDILAYIDHALAAAK